MLRRIYVRTWVDYFHLFKRSVDLKKDKHLFPRFELLGDRFHIAAMPKRKHSIEKDRLLLAEVVKHPFLYDRNHDSFGNHQMRQDKWEEIGAIVGISDMDAKLRWINIRDCFTRCWKRNRKRETSQSFRCPYKYADQLEFYLPYMSLEPSFMEDLMKVDGEGSDVNDADCGDLPTQVLPRPQVPTKRKKRSEPEEDGMMQYLVTHNSAPREDGLDTFFKSICATVRTLPPMTQAQLRFEITELVFKAEMNFLSTQNDQAPVAQSSIAIDHTLDSHD
ncbi:uncharacterized protein LOC121413936 isoform X3 [Lytechinus variegatus]|uniref:uncharacterized protein LOC121413936 isoform X3 n=1 Tax=Lytechinus variegatus TaxID=7654 RepID=UPI001BB11A91|nr:uncharacterized protein LOC121413936 isoform X3 [Lytechinus variegatus]